MKAVSVKFSGIAQSAQSRATGWTTGVRFSVGARDFFLHSIQTGSGVHQASYPIGTGTLSPGVKRPGRESDHPHLVPRSRMMALYLHSPLRLHGVVLNQLNKGTTLTLSFAFTLLKPISIILILILSSCMDNKILYYNSTRQHKRQFTLSEPVFLRMILILSSCLVTNSGIRSRIGDVKASSVKFRLD
jgi:hypothetical protein